MNYEVEFIKIFPCYYQYVGYLRIAPLRKQLPQIRISLIRKTEACHMWDMEAVHPESEFLLRLQTF